MALMNQTAHSADPFSSSRKEVSRGVFLSCVSVSLLFSLLFLVSIPVTVCAFTQGDLYRHAKASTVLIVGINDESNALSFGSGVVISEQGLVLTNAHVVEDSTRLFVYIRNQAID